MKEINCIKGEFTVYIYVEKIERPNGFFFQFCSVSHYILSCIKSTHTVNDGCAHLVSWPLLMITIQHKLIRLKPSYFVEPLIPDNYQKVLLSEMKEAPKNRIILNQMHTDFISGMINFNFIALQVLKTVLSQKRSKRNAPLTNHQ